MARSSIIATGQGITPRTFQVLFCATEQALTPHSAGRLLAQDEAGISIEVKCRRCGNHSVYATPQLSDGYHVYQIRITGEDGPHLPAALRPLPYLEEAFAVVARSLQDAHERAEFACRLPFTGHLTHYYIDGELHLNERF